MKHVRRAAVLVAVSIAGLFGRGGPSVPAAVSPQGPTTTTSQVAAESRVDPLLLINIACEAAVAEMADKLSPEKVVAVLPFVDPDGGVRRLGVLAADEIQRTLLAGGKRLADRQHLDMVLAEKDLQLATLSTADATRRAGELSGADVLLLGSLMETGGSVLVSAKLVAVETGQPIAISTAHSIPAEGLGELMWYVRRPTTEQASGELPPLSLRYEFVTPIGGGEASLADGATVSSGQRFKVRIQPNSDCHLYVLLYDSQGRASVLFPHEKIKMSNEVRGGVSYEIPEGTKWYWFDEQPGTETFYVVASYAPLNDLDQLLAELQQAGAQQVQVAAAAREHIDKVVTRGMSSDTSGEYRPKGAAIRTRGVGGVVDIGWGTSSAGATAEMDNIVSGHATVVKKIVLSHR